MANINKNQQHKRHRDIFRRPARWKSAASRAPHPAPESSRPTRRTVAPIRAARWVESSRFQPKLSAAPKNFWPPKSFNYSRTTLWRTPSSANNIAMTNALIWCRKFLAKILMLLKTIWARLENKLVIIALPGKQLAKNHLCPTLGMVAPLRS